MISQGYEHPLRVMARPLLVQRLRKFVFRPKQIYDLGAGTNILADSYRPLKDEGVKEVYVIDPSLVLQGECRSPKVIPLRSEEGAPVELPAMMLHPGFTLSSERHSMYTRAAATPTWESTLDKLRPSWIVWSSYAIDEYEGDAWWLHQRGYTVMDMRIPVASKDWEILGCPEDRYCAVIAVARRKENHEGTDSRTRT